MVPPKILEMPSSWLSPLSKLAVPIVQKLAVPIVKKLAVPVVRATGWLYGTLGSIKHFRSPSHGGVDERPHQIFVESMAGRAPAVVEAVIGV